MPIIKSAKKRVRTAQKAAIRNDKSRRVIKSTTKAFQGSLPAKNSKKTAELQSAAQSAIDKALKHNIMHKNKAARKKAQLAKQSKAAGVTITKKQTSKTPVSKKTATAKTKASKPTKK